MSTLTPVLNEERHIRSVVADLRAQDIAGEAEFIFIDGRSTDRTRAILDELKAEDDRIRVLHNPQRQTAAALNIGLRAARGDYVARIDGHSRYPTHYLSRGIERLRRGDVDWVAGPQAPVGHGRWSTLVALALGTPLATGASRRWESDVAAQGGKEVELGTGVFTGIWRRATLDAEGGWDEGWPVNQDSEMAARVLRRGGRIVSLPELAARYTPRDSLLALARQYRRYGTYRAKTALRHPWTVRPPHLLSPALVLAAASAAAFHGRAGRVARGALGAYLAGVLLQSARTTRNLRDTVGLVAVFATMHASWGAGFLLGLARFASPATRQPALAVDLYQRVGGR